MGPFYCPDDEKVYIDLAFYRQLLRKAQQGLAQAQSNQLSVHMELQADCLSGVCAHQTEQQRRTLEAGDLEEPLNTASRIGDDTQQRESSGRVRPTASPTARLPSDSVGHVATGFPSGNMTNCDTFSARQL